MKKPLVYCGVAILVVGAVLSVFFGERILVHFFGPPKVALNEAYGGDRGKEDFDHSDFDRILAAHVDEHGFIDYEALRSQEAELDAYLARLAEVHFVQLTRDAKLALFINAYNAFTMRLILEYMPQTSIKQIPEAKRWDDQRWNIGGRTFSLTQIEHEELRAKFVEPRIHFAVVCASTSCPPLRAEAFTAARIEAQLEDQAKRFHSSKAHFELTEGGETLRLSRLYLWYGDDFSQVAGSGLDFAAKWSPELAKRIESGETPGIEWITYDWSLNESKKSGN